MLRARKTHYLFWLLIAYISLTIGCNSSCNRTAPTGQDPTPLVQPAISELPFSTREPAVYQAEIVITISGDGIASEQKYFTARDGEKRRTDHHLSQQNMLTILDLAEGKTLALQPQKGEKKCSAEKVSTVGGSATQGEAFTDFLTNEWLAEKIAAGFEDLGKEDIAGKSLAKFKVRFEKVNGVENISEATVWVDDELGMPVRTEFYSLKDGQRVNSIVTEFRNIKLSVEPHTFAKPEGCKDVSVDEMQKTLWQEKLNAE